MDIPFNQITKVADDIIDWLPTAEEDDILFYAKSLPHEDGDFVTNLADQVVFVTRYIRIQFLEECFSVNISLLPELKIIEFVDSLTKYNTSSVLKTFAREFPQLNECVILKDPVNQAKDSVILWKKLILFLGCLHITDHDLLLRSLLSMNQDISYYEEKSQQCADLIERLTEEFRESEYVLEPYQQDEQHAIELIMQSLEFIPDELIKQLLDYLQAAQLYTLLNKINDICQVITRGLSIGLALDQYDAYLAFLVEEYSINEQVHYISQYDTSKIDVANPLENSWLIYFSQLIQPVFLRQKLVLKDLLKLYSQSDQERFKILLQSFIQGSFVISTTIRPLSTNNLISSIKLAKSKKLLASYQKEIIDLYPEDRQNAVSEVIMIVSEFFE